MDRSEVIQRVREYNKTLSGIWCTSLEKQYIKQVEESSYFYGFFITEPEVPESAAEFFEQQRKFNGLLKENKGKLCDYLTHIQEYTCNDELIRMDVRSRDFSRYKRKILRAVGSFYLFYGAEMSMKHLIYGMYRDVFGSVDFAPVIAEELLCGNEEVVQYCKDVLTSENNTAVITRDVIVAIEQSHNKELQQMLTQVLLAAKLQEGLRQSILETVDENNLEYFLEMTEVIERENLLRFSSVQRAVMTWIGLGYEEVKEKEIRYVFERIRLYFQDEEARGSALREAVNPLEVYLALYCKGVRDVEEAVQEACALLEDKRRYVVASALIYMKLTRCFSVKKYLDFPEKFRDDEWILALYFSECVRTDCGKCGMSASEAHRLYDYIEAFLPLAKSRKTWASKGFEWFSLTLGREGLCYSMFEILDAYPGEDIVERFLPYVASNLSGKRLDWFMENYFCLASEKARKEFMVKEIISSDDALSAWIEKEYKKIVLTEEDIVRLEERLKTKKAAARAHIVNVLADQGKESVKASYSRLIDSSVKTIRESAVELKNKTLQYWKDDVVRQTEILGRESGFGIYERSQIYELPVLNFLPVKKKGFFRKRETVDISFWLPWNKEQVLTYLRKWNARLTWHENEEYYDGSGYHQVKERRFFPIDYKKRTLDAMPLGELWRRYFEEDALTDGEVFEIRFLTETIRDDVYWERVLKGTEGLFTLSMDDVKELSYYSHFSRLLEYYFMEREAVADYAEKAAGFLQLIMQYSKERTYWKKESYNNEETYVEYSLSGNRSFWFMEERLGLNGADEKNFRRYFPVIFQIYQHFAVETGGSVRNKMKISPLVLARAAQLEMIPRSVLYEGILDDHMEAEKKRYYRGSQGQLFEAYRDAYYEGRGIWGRPHLDMEKYQHMRYQYGREVYEYLRAALDMIADRLLYMEAQRLNEKTVVTEYVRRLSVIRGAKYLMLALRVLEGENLRRQNSNGDRAEVFSDVIRNCYPSPGDDLKGCLEEGISRERLVEVAMLAPQWIDKVSEVLKWEGFKEACYYFTAHMKQYDFEQKKAEIARYTELEPEELSDGAFDIKWCRQVYETLGEQRFQVIYKASKFLCENSFHTRARKYADACLGKTPKEVWRGQVEEKRNKDALNAYCICPIQDDADLLERYLYVQQFVKEAKKYGAQRQASENRAAKMALLNLARNSRFETVTRLSWMMESEMVLQNEGVLKPSVIVSGRDEIEAWIEIGEQGSNEICIRKNGKRKKAVPAAFKKHERILALKEIHSQWDEQYRRSRMMLQQAMEERSGLSVEELEAVMKNPIIAPMMKKLVLISGNYLGFYENGRLRTLEGAVDFVRGEVVRIAHPYDLYENGCWHEYQKTVLEQRMVQPFRQVFRELYLKMEDEMDVTESRRYSGYQIQTKKAAAVLKGRKWNVSYESGLERVYYKENLVVNLFAEADWFSPSDIEAPSIDYVAFYSRKDGRPVLIKEIDPVTFSETMRDVDLAVSTAYVGGVDPVTSFSTIELRRNITEFTCRLMKLENVTLQEHFANIKGSLNDYSVHLGSGVVHQSGGAAIHIVAVHSQKRGKVYLPFLDEDPKTAEILSKIVMLAEDNKIKDPEILRQIQSMK